MASIALDSSDMEKHIHDLEFENEQYMNAIEKEKAFINALEDQYAEYEADIVRLQKDTSQLDDDMKLYHRQFIQNRDSIENLKSTVRLTQQIDALKDTYQHLVEQGQRNKAKHAESVKHYTQIWQEYEAQYASMPKCQQLKREKLALQKAQDDLSAAIQRKQRAKDALNDIQARKGSSFKPYRTVNELVIKLAELKVTSMKKMAEKKKINQKCEVLGKKIKKRIKKQALRKKRLQKEQLKRKQLETRRWREAAKEQARLQCLAKKEAEMHHQKEQARQKLEAMSCAQKPMEVVVTVQQMVQTVSVPASPKQQPLNISTTTTNSVWMTPIVASKTFIMPSLELPRRPSACIPQLTVPTLSWPGGTEGRTSVAPGPTASPKPPARPPPDTPRRQPVSVTPFTPGKPAQLARPAGGFAPRTPLGRPAPVMSLSTRYSATPAPQPRPAASAVSMPTSVAAGTQPIPPPRMDVCSGQAPPALVVSARNDQAPAQMDISTDSSTPSDTIPMATTMEAVPTTPVTVTSTQPAPAGAAQMASFVVTAESPSVIDMMVAPSNTTNYNPPRDGSEKYTSGKTPTRPIAETPKNTPRGMSAVTPKTPITPFNLEKRKERLKLLDDTSPGFSYGRRPMYEAPQQEQGTSKPSTAERDTNPFFQTFQHITSKGGGDAIQPEGNMQKDRVASPLTNSTVSAPGSGGVSTPASLLGAGDARNRFPQKFYVKEDDDIAFAKRFTFGGSMSPTVSGISMFTPASTQEDNAGFNFLQGGQESHMSLFDGHASDQASANSAGSVFNMFGGAMENDAPADDADSDSFSFGNPPAQSPKTSTSFSLF